MGEYVGMRDPCRHVSRLDVIRWRLAGEDERDIDEALAHADVCRRVEEQEEARLAAEQGERMRPA